MSEHYILDGHDVVPAELMTWARWFEKGDRTVKKTTIGESKVSTVFLGLDHNFGVGPPQLFETMVFGGPLKDEMYRCATWEQAEACHDAMCERVRVAVNGTAGTNENAR